MLYGFNLERAKTLNRVADREGLAARTDTSIKYPKAGESFLRAGYLAEALPQGGTATATELIWNGSAWEDGDEFEVTDLFLNTGETVEADTKLVALPIGEVWVPITYCAASDTLPS